MHVYRRSPKKTKGNGEKDDGMVKDEQVLTMAIPMMEPILLIYDMARVPTPMKMATAMTVPGKTTENMVTAVSPM